MNFRAIVFAAVLNAICSTSYAADITHDWAVQLGGRDVGLIEYRDSFTGRLGTVIFYGFGQLQFDFPALGVVTIPSTLLIVAAMCFYVRHRLRFLNAA